VEEEELEEGRKCSKHYQRYISYNILYFFNYMIKIEKLENTKYLGNFIINRKNGYEELNSIFINTKYS